MYLFLHAEKKGNNDYNKDSIHTNVGSINYMDNYVIYNFSNYDNSKKNTDDTFLIFTTIK